ncbi:MAG: hypothetical protein P8Y99_15815, partial [Calditrichaceae bacterium]
MNILNKTTSTLVLLILSFFLSSCYTQFAVVERQTAKKVIVEGQDEAVAEAEEYVEDVDTVYYEDEGEASVYIDNYNEYGYPDYYRYGYNIYNPWYGGYYWDSYYYGSCWDCGYYPYGYYHRYPYVVVYDPYYYNYYDWHRTDRYYGDRFKPRPFNREGSTVLRSRSSRITSSRSGSVNDMGFRPARTVGTSSKTPISTRTGTVTRKGSRNTSGTNDFMPVRTKSTKVSRVSGSSDTKRAKKVES